MFQDEKWVRGWIYWILQIINCWNNKHSPTINMNCVSIKQQYCFMFVLFLILSAQWVTMSCFIEIFIVEELVSASESRSPGSWDLLEWDTYCKHKYQHNNSHLGTQQQQRGEIIEILIVRSMIIKITWQTMCVKMETRNREAAFIVITNDVN